MKYVVDGHRIAAMNDGDEVAYATFPLIEGRKNKVNINHTFVEAEFRGQGVGEKMMKEIISLAEQNNWIILPTCPFAMSWFERNTEYSHILKPREENA